MGKKQWESECVEGNTGKRWHILPWVEMKHNSTKHELKQINNKSHLKSSDNVSEIEDTRVSVVKEIQANDDKFHHGRNETQLKQNKLNKFDTILPEKQWMLPKLEL